MDAFKIVINALLRILQLNISIGGYQFSLYSVLLFTMIGTLIFSFIFHFFRTN